MIGLSHRPNLILKVIPKSSSSYCCKRQYNASRILMTAFIEQQNTEAPIIMPKKNKKVNRSLLLEVLKSNPSQRDALSYIKRFTIPNVKPPAPPPIPVEIKESKSTDLPAIPEKDSRQSLQSSKEEFVDSLFATKFEHIALIKIQGPFTPLDLKSVAKTLVHLQKLGLMPIAILDNDMWADMLKEGPSRFDELRQWMTNDSVNFCEALEEAGGRATPIYNGVFTLTHNEFEKYDKKKIPHSSLMPRTLSTSKINVSLSWLKSTLKMGHIPLILPIAVDGLSIHRTIQPNAGMTALSSSLSDLSNTACLNLKTPHLEPMKIIVINREGGIPSEERKGSHVFINVQQEYDDIKKSYKENPQWKFTHPTGLGNFEMIKTCLEKLPSTTSAIMVPQYFPTGLITNLITDKPLFSSSLPLMAPTTPSTNTTVIRHGLQVFHHNSLSTINIPSLCSLIEASFKKKLDTEKYISRMEKCLDTIIITGDYQGAAIVTMEGKGDVPYLDKLAVLPNHQGTGIADILWKQLQIKYPNLLWRSRGDNVINKWYFERSDGNYRIPETHWVMFWYGYDGINKLKTYTETARKIPPSLL